MSEVGTLLLSEEEYNLESFLEKLIEINIQDFKLNEFKNKIFRFLLEANTINILDLDTIFETLLLQTEYYSYIIKFVQQLSKPDIKEQLLILIKNGERNQLLKSFITELKTAFGNIHPLITGGNKKTKRNKRKKRNQTKSRRSIHGGGFLPPYAKFLLLLFFAIYRIGDANNTVNVETVINDTKYPSFKPISSSPTTSLPIRLRTPPTKGPTTIPSIISSNIPSISSSPSKQKKIIEKTSNVITDDILIAIVVIVGCCGVFCLMYCQWNFFCNPESWTTQREQTFKEINQNSKNNNDGRNGTYITMGPTEYERV